MLRPRQSGQQRLWKRRPSATTAWVEHHPSLVPLVGTKAGLAGRMEKGHKRFLPSRPRLGPGLSVDKGPGQPGRWTDSTLFQSKPWPPRPAVGPGAAPGIHYTRVHMLTGACLCTWMERSQSMGGGQSPKRPGLWEGWGSRGSWSTLLGDVLLLRGPRPQQVVV